MRNLPIFLFLLLGYSADGAFYRHTSPAFVLDYNDTTWRVAPNKGVLPKEDVDKEMAQKTLVTLERIKPTEKYHSRVGVVLDSKLKGKEKKTFEQYRAEAVEFLAGQRFHIQRNESYKQPNVDAPAVEIIASQRDFGLTFRQVILEKDGDVYLLTGACRTSEADQQLPELKTIMDSFRFSATH